MQEINKVATKDKSMEKKTKPKKLEVVKASGKGWMFAVWMEREEEM